MILKCFLWFIFQDKIIRNGTSKRDLFEPILSPNGHKNKTSNYWTTIFKDYDPKVCQNFGDLWILLRLHLKSRIGGLL